MRSLKQILFLSIFSIIIFQTSNSFAQTDNTSYKEVSQDEISGYDLSIPNEFKLNVTKNDNAKLFTIKRYDKKLGGYVYITGAEISPGTVKIKSIKVPKILRNPGCPSGYRACARSCNDKPTTLGTGLCIAYCIIDCGATQL